MATIRFPTLLVLPATFWLAAVREKRIAASLVQAE